MSGESERGSGRVRDRVIDSNGTDKDLISFI